MNTYKRLFITFFIFSICFNAFAQELNSVTDFHKHIHHESQEDNLISFNLAASDIVNNTPSDINGDKYYHISDLSIEKIRQIRKEPFLLSIQQSEDSNIIIEFNKSDLIHENFIIRTASGKTLDFPKDLKIYSGKIIDNDGWATMSIYHDKITMLIADKNGSFEIFPYNRNLHIGRFSDFSQKNLTFDCHTEDETFREVLMLPQGNGIRYGNCLEIFVECDYRSYIDHGSSNLLVANWVVAIMNNVNQVYQMHDVPLYLREIFIWDIQDPYIASQNLSALNQSFVNFRQNNYDGRVASLFSTRNLGGGLAHGLGGFCNEYPQYPGPFYSATNLSLANDIFPNYAYNTYLVAHELGHVLGLRHSHACVWNGNFTQIDDCGNQYAYDNNQTIEGNNCFDPASPILPSAGGTIMSNCHLLPYIGIELSQGFGTVAGSKLYQNYTYSDCLTGEECFNIRPINNFCPNAINLIPKNSCELQTFSNVSASQSGATPGFSCGNSNPAIDVWFKVTIPESGNIIIETGQVSGGLTDMVIQTYSGNCNALVAVECDDNSGPDNHARVVLTNRIPGEVIFVRVVDSGNDQTGIFGICAYDEDIPCHPELEALLSLYSNTNGPSWINNSGWIDGAAGNNCDVCTWFGIICDEEDRVIGIRLSNNNLSGVNSLPIMLTDIELLMELVLYNNNLSGSLPTWLHQITYLHTLDLGSNNYSGLIPQSFGLFPNLKNLYLDNNQLNGALLEELKDVGLNLLYLNRNNFTGCFPVDYVVFCNKAYDFSENPNLPGSGNFADFCLNGFGQDFDGDGYCNGVDDCDDNDPEVYLGALEICDGKDNDCDGFIDEDLQPQTNVWVGDSTGVWHLTGNWSLGIIPANCTDVIINNAIVSIESELTAIARSVVIQSQATLVISQHAMLKLEEVLNIQNQGELNVLGTISISSPLDNNIPSFVNDGTTQVNEGGEILIENGANTCIRNNTSGNIINNGSITILGNSNLTGLFGVDNEGSILNNNILRITSVNGIHLRVAPLGNLNNMMNVTLD